MKRKEGLTQGERMKQAIRHRQEQEKQELRQAILAAAGELFLEQGYEKFSLRKVAERVGYSATTIYIYFRDKDDLLFTLVDEGFVRFRQQLHTAMESTPDPWARIMALGRAYVRFGLTYPLYYQLMFMQRSDFLLDKQVGEQRPRIEAFVILRDAVQQAIDAQVLRPGDAETYSNVLWALMHGLVSLSISVSLFDEASLQNALQTINQLLEHGLKV